MELALQCHLIRDNDLDQSCRRPYLVGNEQRKKMEKRMNNLFIKPEKRDLVNLSLSSGVYLKKSAKELAKSWKEKLISFLTNSR